MNGPRRLHTFYMDTVRSVWAYFVSITGDPSLADDLTQETYLRMLTATVALENEDHRKHYLFRIASNLIGDQYRAGRWIGPMPAIEPSVGDQSNSMISTDLLGKALLHVRRAERTLLWLACAEDLSHREISAITGYREDSVRPLLHKARRNALSMIRKLLGS